MKHAIGIEDYLADTYKQIRKTDRMISNLLNVITVFYAVFELVGFLALVYQRMMWNYNNTVAIGMMIVPMLVWVIMTMIQRIYHRRYEECKEAYEIWLQEKLNINIQLNKYGCCIK